MTTPTPLCLADIAALRAATWTSALAPQIVALEYNYVAGDGGGLFRCDVADTSSADNNGTIILTSTSGTALRYKRIYTGPIYATWFGVRADGSTDDTTAWGDVHAVAPAGSEIVVPKGTSILSNLTITKSLTLSGEGEACVIKQKASTADDMIEVRTSGVELIVKDVVLDGNQASQSALSENAIIRIEIGGSSIANPTILHCELTTFLNPCRGAIYFFTDTSDATEEILRVRNCRFFGGYEAGTNDTNVTAYINAADTATIEIVDNLLDFGSSPTNGRTGIFVSAITTDADPETDKRVTVRGNTFRRLGANIAAATGALELYLWASRAFVSDNRFEDSNYCAIKGKSSAKQLIIESNIIDKVRSGNSAIALNPSTYGTPQDQIVIRNNLVRNVSLTTTGVIDIDTKESTDYSEGVIVEGNSIYGSTGYGVRATNSKNGRIRGNHFFSAESTKLTSAVFVSDCTGTWQITDNQSYGSTGYDYYVDTNDDNLDLVMRGNLSQDCTGTYAFLIGARHAHFSSNTILNAVNGVSNLDVSTLVMRDNICIGTSGTLGFAPSLANSDSIGLLFLENNYTDEATNGFYLAGAITTAIVRNNQAPSASAPLTVGGTVTNLYEQDNSWNTRVGAQTLNTNADFTLTAGSSPQQTYHTGTLTAHRSVTLSGGRAGDRFRVTRTGAGGFNLNVGSGPLKTLASGTWCEVVHTGSAWSLAASGSL